MPPLWYLYCLSPSRTQCVCVQLCVDIANSRRKRKNVNTDFRNAAQSNYSGIHQERKLNNTVSHRTITPTSFPEHFGKFYTGRCEDEERSFLETRQGTEQGTVKGEISKIIPNINMLLRINPKYKSIGSLTGTFIFINYS